MKRRIIMRNKIMTSREHRDQVTLLKAEKEKMDIVFKFLITNKREINEKHSKILQRVFVKLKKAKERRRLWIELTLIKKIDGF